MTYAVKEIYPSIQGEGGQTGRPAVFLRFAGCNLWSGRESDRAAAVCKFCDTDFVGTDGGGGGSFATAAELAARVAAAWQADNGWRPFVVATGGEPLLQLDERLLDALHDRGFEVAVETNGTRRAPAGVDWICVSPKAGAPCVQTAGHELKVVYPQVGLSPDAFLGFDFDRFYLQPMDGPAVERNLALAARYCLEHPRWRLSIQTHKLLGVP
jgi:7-carboxy-7-deazaguanine synthase (Cx14CxxC type)